MILLILSKMRISKLYIAAMVLFLAAFVNPCVKLGAEEESNMNNPFGVLEFLHWNHSWNSYKYACVGDWDKAVKLMKEAGVGWVRMDFLWQDIEPSEGEFDFDKYDQIVELLNENNIQILGLLNYSASWASASKDWNCPPQNNEVFVKYAVKVIKRYKGKVNYWEVWNEPDSAVYWSNQDGLKSYCSLLKDVYIAAKKVNPDCKILNGGLAHGLSSINRLYDNGAKNYFDILNLHFFETPLHEGGIKAVVSYPKLAYKIMVKHGDKDKKIWFTEIGCPGVKKGSKVNEWWLGKNPTEKQQALWVKKVYTELLKNKSVEKIYWAFFRDCSGHWDTGVDYFGLVRWNFSKKPSFKAYKECYEKWRRSVE
ncbi:MAG: beta-galactosidase [Candidatus Omnitrophica bacterium]|nr:beta-galactosidase [Candidatus Omnitrophota bacterium]